MFQDIFGASLIVLVVALFYVTYFRVLVFVTVLVPGKRDVLVVSRFGGSGTFHGRAKKR